MDSKILPAKAFVPKKAEEADYPLEFHAEMVRPLLQITGSKNPLET